MYLTNLKLFFYYSFFFLILSTPIFSQNNIAYIKVISPNGGENWQARSTQTITWQSYNVEKVKIEFTFNDGYTWRPIATLDAGLGKYSWYLPNSQTGGVLIKITDIANPSIYDISDTPFSIYIKQTINKAQKLNKTTAAPPAGTIKILPLGDSITDGEGDDPLWDQTIEGYIAVVGYREKLFNLLRSHGYRFNFVGHRETGYDDAGSPYDTSAFYDHGRRNEGHGGWSAKSSDPNWSIADHLNDWLTAFQPDSVPDVILFHAGTNDLSPISDDATTVANDIHTNLDIINNFDPNIRTIFAKIPWQNHASPQSINDALNGSGGTLQNLYNSLISSGRDVSLVNMYAVLSQANYDAGPSDFLFLGT